MLDQFLRRLGNIFSRGTPINIKDIHNSSVAVTVVKWGRVVFRAPFAVSKKWFDDLLKINYDDEIKYKYIPELHQINQFERSSLNDIVDPQNWKNAIIQELTKTNKSVLAFQDSYNTFRKYLKAEQINIITPIHRTLTHFNTLHLRTQSLTLALQKTHRLLLTINGEIHLLYDALKPIQNPIAESISTRQIEDQLFFDRQPNELYHFASVFRTHNHLFEQLNDLNLFFERLLHNINHKIIVGDAGAGKTHVLAHIVNTIHSNGEYVVFFKPKHFNGDDVDLEDRLLKLMQIPKSYTLDEILNRMNAFGNTKKKRCFIIIDALNETTKASIGFSPIWKNGLQTFINKIRQYPYLYFVCSLRTSYVDSIWVLKPTLHKLKGFTGQDIKAAVKKYFEYYRIKATNFHDADLDYFKVPLLLDLFCKLTNQSRLEEKTLTLGFTSYQKIFEEYVENLISEVKTNLNLEKAKPIREGIAESSEKFLANKEAVISIEDFTDSFDKDSYISKDNSIARRVLEGYLVFIKDIVPPKNEIVKHTQQEIGGYLLAWQLCEKYPTSEKLIESSEFKIQITGSDSSNHHQLKFDILKFLIALRPAIILDFKDDESLVLAWWYVYNGLDSKKHGDKVQNYLLSQVQNQFIDEILEDSIRHLFNPSSDFNWNFTAKIFERMNSWDFNNTWTFYIYKNAEQFSELIRGELAWLRKNEPSDDPRNFLIAKFVAYVTATTTRELRDLATVYLIEYGKRNPIRLLDLTEYSSILSDTYIYERLVACCYGIALILQHDDKFVKNHLGTIANRLYQRQLYTTASHPVFNYIVVDSIKHLVDLALAKKAIDVEPENITRLRYYSFPPPHQWTKPTDEQFVEVNEHTRYSFPEPIGSDFGIYTIPRLINDDVIPKSDAIVNVYNRVYELGYQNSKSLKFDDKLFRDFFFGDRNLGGLGKIDRLGKKYSWLAFFDYAGNLLQEGKLNVFDENENRKVYDRLTDVDIDICIPSKTYKRAIRLYKDDLIPDRDKTGWTREVKIDSLREFFHQKIDGVPYTLLHGLVEKRFDKEYKSRSYLFAESWLIEKTAELDELKNAISGKEFDWDLDIHSSPDTVRHAYFGELFWSDSVAESDHQTIFIPTGKEATYKKTLTFLDVLHSSSGYSSEDVGTEIEELRPERIAFESEPTLTEYLWESESETIPTFSEFVPSIRIAKRFELKADPGSGKILDKELKECYQCIDFDEDNFENNFKYIRSDILKTYMEEKNLAILLQIKQHSYDGDNDHIRTMKFFVIDNFSV